MKTENLQQWQRILLARRRQTALNVLKNHFEEVVKLNTHVPRFQKTAKHVPLKVEDFLFEAASSETFLLHKSAVTHFRKIVESWPAGTIAWEHLPPEKNPYGQSEALKGFKALTHQELCVKELLSEHHDLILQTFSQGRKAAALGLMLEACETTDEVLKATWLLGFEAGQKELNNQLNQESEKQS